ncbi:MAG TPA: N-acetyl-gamma-glutamyl-phosphate reductase [Phycisphaerae bacterium]
MKTELKVYVDGQEGTTGLRIHEYLAARPELSVLRIDTEKRKDADERKRLLNSADFVFLCLPEAASREAVGLIENPETKVIDASTAFRTDLAWAYGLPELGGELREKIRGSKRVAVPGCHASAFLLGIAPLVKVGIVPAETPLSCFSLTGYSGGGRKMIAAYENDPPAKLRAPRPYALKLMHKHLPEMQRIAGLKYAPMFTPVVCNVHSGLSVETFLHASMLKQGTTPQKIQEALSRHYAGEKFVRVMPFDAEATLDEGAFDIMACNGTNRADMFVFGHEGQIAVMTRLDNLGKGAAGAAIQCLNLMMGVEEGMGLQTESTR